MMTRNIHQPTHGPGMATDVADAHGQMVYAPIIVGNTPTMHLPVENRAYDPSDPTTTSEAHYNSDASMFTPVATRVPPIAMYGYTRPRWVMPSDLTTPSQQ
jgi:hypothetical protein